MQALDAKNGYWLENKIAKKSKICIFSQNQREFKTSSRGQNINFCAFVNSPKSVDNFSYPHYDHNMCRSQAKNKRKFEILKKFFFFFFKL